MTATGGVFDVSPAGDHAEVLGCVERLRTLLGTMELPLPSGERHTLGDLYGRALLDVEASVRSHWTWLLYQRSIRPASVVIDSDGTMTVRPG